MQAYIDIFMCIHLINTGVPQEFMFGVDSTPLDPELEYFRASKQHHDIHLYDSMY